ncbi:MAG: hypothetical protein ACK5KN_15080 [Dysgonomonas sp.]|jgi:hypothetical protein|uniref:hypothetical protein n=1 Tax=unclassified Dysgonomonas TaxID=2630389 RepID=UPI0025C7140C|nr:MULTISPECIES: hypothetical protein [unclassified Dysgonomonas]MDR1717102.1 hypothetical protein [Prevotella sp.]MDR2003341.1 hypothetical protein [Prevotella sp.]HMM04546.1 hypothetical protein [Dysgonomonas sp.]
MDTNLDDIKHIRSMMERSSKFLSLSGMSGISAGTFALIGALIGHLIMSGQFTFTNSLLYDFIILAVLVLICAGGSGLYFCMRKAQKNGSKLWMPVTIQILKDFSVPMCIGGLFCIVLIFQHAIRMVAPSMLIFYGLALIAAGSRTYRDIKVLGACEIILGLLAGIFVYNGLLFWTLGFGVLHIVYGILIYYKYDMKSVKNG